MLLIHTEGDKDWYRAQHLGELEGRVTFLQAARDHYYKLASERATQLRELRREVKALKRELKRRASSADEQREKP